jgi:hypothetical protein
VLRSTHRPAECANHFGNPPTPHLPICSKTWLQNFWLSSELKGACSRQRKSLAKKVTDEFTARVREVLRRPGLGASWISGVIQVGDLKLDLQRHVLLRGGNEIHLPPKEFDLLAFMMKNAGVLLTHAKLLRSVWGLSYGGELEYQRTYICTLRTKIEENPAEPE